LRYVRYNRFHPYPLTLLGVDTLFDADVAAPVAFAATVVADAAVAAGVVPLFVAVVVAFADVVEEDDDEEEEAEEVEEERNKGCVSLEVFVDDDRFITYVGYVN
jgi:cadmium resistance protein CadD (predicted permease)